MSNRQTKDSRERQEGQGTALNIWTFAKS
jgi:hypothetical protein